MNVLCTCTHEQSNHKVLSIIRYTCIHIEIIEYIEYREYNITHPQLL